MGGLKPIGSEKLQGMDKIARMIEIARYKENIPQRVNETKKTEYTIGLADGNNYEIVKERQGYIIKKRLSESVVDYIEPIQNRKYYSSYSQALKRLNIMTKEINTLNEIEEGVSLFGEQKKFKLKVPKPETPAPAPELPPAPMPAPAPEVAPPTDVPPMDSETPDMGTPPMGNEAPPVDAPPMDSEAPGMDMPEDDMPPMDTPEDNEPMDGNEGDNSFKSIQKLVGKLGQKLRTFSDASGDEMSSDNVKYVINSILSALDLTVLDDDDLDEIVSRLEGDEEDEEMDDVDMEEPMDDEMDNEMGDEMMPEPPPAPEGEMGENYGHAIGNKFSQELADNIRKMGGRANFGAELSEFEDESWFDDADRFNRKDADFGFEDTGEDFTIEDDDVPFRKRGPRGRISYSDIDEMFAESKVDKILDKYITEDVKRKTSDEYKKFKKNVKNLSESVKQERTALKFFETNQNLIVLGKTNKGNLMIKEGKKIHKITTDGKVL